MKLRAKLSVGLLSIITASSLGCENRTPHEGTVVNEVSYDAKLNCPYGFTIRTIDGNFRAYKVNSYDAAAVDSLINIGDKVRVRESSHSPNLSLSQRDIELVEKFNTE